VIANRQEFEVTLKQLKSVEQALEILREDLKDAGPALQTSGTQAYERRIASLQTEIANYLHSHPADLSLLTRTTEANLVSSS
jgi:hypothetical protein